MLLSVYYIFEYLDIFYVSNYIWFSGLGHFWVSEEDGVLTLLNYDPSTIVLFGVVFILNAHYIKI
jgi:hypothetical protein